ncbi:hypothetical protein Tco_0727407 [Tanacetum coccineum]|uniref:Uncharacterized protein n=1 Tax=Tanacetum coccineum TaxID=301880 RepID=A0ABQ4YJ98_9ASTR
MLATQTSSRKALMPSLEHFDAVTRICDAVSTHCMPNLDHLRVELQSCPVSSQIESKLHSCPADSAVTNTSVHSRLDLGLSHLRPYRSARQLLEQATTSFTRERIDLLVSSQLRVERRGLHQTSSFTTPIRAPPSIPIPALTTSPELDIPRGLDTTPPRKD